MSGDTFYCHSCVWGCHLYLVGRSKGCCLTPYSAQDSLPQQRTILPKTSRVQTLRNKPFADIRNSPSIISTQEYNSHQQHIFLQWSGSCAKEGNKEKFPQSRMLGSSFGTYVQVGLHPTQRVKRLAESVKTGHWCDQHQQLWSHLEHLTSHPRKPPLRPPKPLVLEAQQCLNDDT